MKTALTLFLTLALLWQCQKQEAHTGPDLKQIIDSGARVIDVRSLPEYQSGHYPGALHIPYDEVDFRLAELPSRENPLVLYCASGFRSAKAAIVLRKHGYQVIDAGGLQNMPR
ncbi:MAG: rhodanese-like domain-containing protein [Spirochaetales bacterium]|nr:rhodanese-like domain-containing protein [Spirochaetales bacterium]